MKVLMTGATGFLGSHLAERLVNHGHEVRAVVRKSSKTDFLEGLGAELAHASLETGEGLRDAVQGVDAVVHGAAVVKARSAEEFHEVNAGGTERLLDAVRAHNPSVRRFVLVSSLAAHGFGTNGNPRPADAAPNPVTHYGRSKLAAEQAVLDAKDDVPVTIIRPPAIYGPRDTEMFKFFQIVNTGVCTFLGSADNRLSLVYAPCCARAIHTALDKDHPSGRTYFVEDGRTYTQREFAEAVERALGRRALKFSVPIGVVQVAAIGSELYSKLANKAVIFTRDKVNELREQQVCDGSEIREELGWEPEVQLDEGARRTVEWYRAQGWL